ncbi:IclR family transcriptional regulator [Bordetella genomosp. 9]|uniref:IclR family transcriptional regulator n=1 Tax=Bordetella genomosp. 9 TaxID=1416803 RepID=A0A261R1W9_9BORD|nr:IclR family transcriptional regulator [Bordetella genomosp. 9]OZI18727.1 IclR family transcriptional regulator [Bordetella genomosp. 9]
MNRKTPPHYELGPREDLLAHPQFASTLFNGLEVLRQFTPAQPSLGNKEIADALGLSRPAVTRLTFTLVGMGLLRRDERTGRYSLGPAVLSLGYPLLVDLTLRQLAAHDMVELARFARGPVSLGVRDRLQVVYVETVEDRDSSGTRPDIGSTRPLLRTAMGRALMYAHTPQERKLICSCYAQAHPADWERFSPALAAAYEDIARDGFVVVKRDWQPNICGIAVPLRYRANGMPLAMSVTIQIDAADDGYVGQVLGPRIASLVRNLDYRLGMVDG